MDKEEYDRLFKDVQELEAQTGLKLLTRNESHYRNGDLSEVSWSNNGRTVFRQKDPFTPHSTYFVDMAEWGQIMYRDPTR